MVILGIDPGTTRAGYGVVKSGQSLQYVDAGLLKIESRHTAERLFEIHQDLSRIIKEFSPSGAAIESIYFNKNKKTAIDVSHARGIILFTLVSHKIPFVEYSPSQVKRAISGTGSAQKEHITRVLEKILKIEFENEHDDVSDALAIALTAALDTSFGAKVRG